MAKVNYDRLIGVLGIVLVFVTGCAEPPAFLQRALGKDVAEKRRTQGEEWCPQITTFAVAPLTVQCGGSVSLELAAAPQTAQLTYTWDIEGQTFEIGQRAVWHAPSGKTIGEPERTYTVRAVVSDGQCAVTRAVEVTVMCNSALEATVYFAFGKAHLDATATAQLDELGAKLQASAQTVLIEGHTDAIGGEKANDRLGERRAAAVKDYLIKKWHVTPDRIMTRSFGEEQPVALNATADGRAQNRRAEVFRVTLTTK